MVQLEGKCPSNGNTGFPVIITGIFSQNTLDNIKFNTNIRISSSPRSTPRTLSKESGFIDELGGDILYYGSTTYSLISLQLAKSYSTQLQTPRQEGPANIQLYAIFKKKLATAINEQFIIVNIPIINATSTEGTAFNKNVTKYFDELLSSSTKTPTKFDILFENQKSCLEYVTCIEAKDINKSKTITFRVLNLDGHIINDKTWEKLKIFFDHVFPSFKLPKSIGFKTTAFKKSINDSNELVISEWSEEGYIYNNIISTGSDEFKKRIIFNSFGINNSNFEKKKSTSKSSGDTFTSSGESSNEYTKSTDEYRCMPLDVDKDIQNNKVLLNPSTASRLSTDIQSDVNAYNAELATDYKKTSMNKIKKILITISIIIAVILGVIAASFLVHFIYNFFKSDKTTSANSINLSDPINPNNSSSGSSGSSGSSPDGGIGNSRLKNTAPMTASVAAPVTASVAAPVTAATKSNTINHLKFPNVPKTKISSPLPQQQIAVPMK